jgi:hypothetical protein
LDIDLLHEAGKWGGICGISLVVLGYILLTLFKGMNLSSLTHDQRYRLVKWAMICFLVISLAGIFWPHREGGSHGDGGNQVMAKSFRIRDCGDEKLIQFVSTALGRRYDASNGASITVDLRYSGSLQPTSVDGNFKYLGGCVVIEIDGSLCTELKTLAIRKWDSYDGYEKARLEATLREDVKAQAANNPETVAEAIRRCVNNAK